MQTILRTLASFMLVGVISLSSPQSMNLVYATEGIQNVGNTPSPEVSANNVNNSDNSNLPSGGVHSGHVSAISALHAGAIPNLPGNVSNLTNHANVEVRGYNSNNRPQFPGYSKFFGVNGRVFSYKYDFGGAAGSTVDAVISRPGTTVDLSTEPLKMNIFRENMRNDVDGVSTMTVLFEDESGAVVTQRINLVNDPEQAEYNFDIREELGFDASKVASITLRLNNADDLPADFDMRQEQRSGTMFVSLGGLNIPESADLSEFSRQTLMEFPSDTQVEMTGFIRGTSTVPGFGTHLVPQGEIHSFRYDISRSGAGAIRADITRKNGKIFDTSGDSMTLALKHDGAEGGEDRHVIVRMKDSNNQEKMFYLDVTDQFQNFILNFNPLDPFDPSLVQSITLEMDQGSSDVRRGQIDFYLPENTTSAVFNQGELYEFPPNIQVESSGSIEGAGSVPGYTRLFAPVNDVYSFRYDVGGSLGSVVRTKISLPASNNLTDIPDPLTLALKNNGNDAKVRVILTDKDNQKKDYYVELTNQFQNFSFSFGHNTGFDRSEIKDVTIEVNRKTSENRTGTIDFYVPLKPDVDPFIQIKPAITQKSVNPNGSGLVDFTNLDGAEVYQVQIARDADFTDIAHEGTPSVSIEGFTLRESRDFFVRVRGSKNSDFNVGPVSLWSDTAILAANVIFDKKPNIISVNHTAGTDLFQVNYSQVAMANLYQIQVSTDVNFTNIVHDTSSDQTSKEMEIEERGNLFVRVRASLSDDFGIGLVSEWSEPTSLPKRVV